MNHWNPTEDSLRSPLMRAMTKLILPHEASGKLRLPDLRQSREIILASDYSGDHDNQFQVLSFLIAAGESVYGAWSQARQEVRARFLANGRRISFKNLSDGHKQKALAAFLQAADKITGALLCIAIDKTIEPFSAMYQLSAAAQCDPFKPKVREKLLRVSAFASAISGGLSAAGQHIRWVMDDDEIVANEKLQDEAGSTCMSMFRLHCPPDCKLTLGIAGKFDDNRMAEDLISVVDLAGGATAENHAALGIDRMPQSTDLFVPLTKRRTTKTQILSAWLSSTDQRLEKFTILVRQHAPGQLLFSIGRPEVRLDMPPLTTPLWTPLDKGWKKSSGWW
jgi:hypothetical protein